MTTAHASAGGTAHTGSTERMLQFIRDHGFATRRDLQDELGIKPGAVDKLLARHINAGMVIEEKFATDSQYPAVTRFRWNSAAAPGTKPRAFRPGAAQRQCLGGCGKPFYSAGPMNRICDICKARLARSVVSPYAP